MKGPIEIQVSLTAEGLKLVKETQERIKELEAENAELGKQLQRFLDHGEALSQENLRMREALGRIDSLFCQKYGDQIEWVRVNAGGFIKDAFQHIPHTMQLAKQRDADLAVIGEAKVPCECALHDTSLENIPHKDFCRISKALAAREKVYAEMGMGE